MINQIYVLSAYGYFQMQVVSAMLNSDRNSRNILFENEEKQLYKIDHQSYKNKFN